MTTGSGCDIFYHIMSKLKDKRKVKGFDQQELADAVGVHRTWINKIEKGADCAPEWLASAIAKVLKTKRHLLFDIEPERRKRYRVKK